LNVRVNVARNLLKAWLVFLIPAAVLGTIGWRLGDYRLALLFAGSIFLLAAVLYWYAERIVMGMVGARELLLAEAPLLHSTVERLAAVAGIAKPKLYVIPDGLPRALATGRGPRSSAIAVSAGCVAACPPAELEGVLAHELAHVRHRDVLIQTGVVVLAGSLLEASRLGGWLERSLLFVLAPVASAFVHLLVSPKREFQADRTAAALLGSPLGLADALVRLDRASELVEFRGSPATEPLYTINPFMEEGLAALFVTHPPVGERVRRLRDLDGGVGPREKAA